MDEQNEWEEDTKQFTDRRWWRCKKAELGDAVWTAFSICRGHDRGRSEAYGRMRALYETGLTGDEGDRIEADGYSSMVSRDNIIGSIVDTANSKLLVHEPAPVCQTTGGNVILRLQAEKLSEWTKEAARQIGVYSEVPAAWLDASICGSGAVRVFERDGAPAIEQSFCEDIYVDPLEARNRAVMTYYQIRVMDRQVLIGLYPEKKGKIAAASASSSEEITEDHLAVSDEQSTADMVTVVLAWRVAPNKRTPGRHVVVLHGGIENVVLDDCEYKDTEAPFVFMHYRHRPRRFWGMGLASMLAPIQAEIDTLGEIIDVTLDTFVPQVWIDGEAVKMKEVDDELGMYYRYEGQPPHFFDPSGQAAQGQRQWQETRIQRGYHIAGVSSTEAGAMKESGLDSGKALRVHQDIKSQRLVMQHKQIEEAYKEVFRRMIAIADRIVEREDEDGERSSDHTNEDRMRYLAGEGDELEELSYEDVRIRDAMYKIEIFPISQLADTPAGRTQQVTEWMNAGLIQGDEALEAMQIPDLKRITDMRTAVQRWAKVLVERAMVGKAGPNDVTSMDDLETIIQYGTVMHSKARMDGTDVDYLENLRNLIARAVDFQAQAMPPAPAPAGPGAPAPAPPAMDPMAMPPGPPPMGPM